MTISGIETLPVELLQPIFFLSGHNVALLQASDRIGARLSSSYVYNATCSHYLTGILDDRTAQTAAQTFIFASRWMTWIFFKSWLTRAYKTSGCLCGLTSAEGCFDAQWPPNFEKATEMVFTRSHLPRLAFIKARIPKKLLCGSWTPDKIQFLQFLLWLTSMTIDWDNDQVRQTAIDGRLQAMREQNLQAVELFNHNRRLGRFATLSTVRLAVMESDCDRSIVLDTMSTAAKWGTVTSWNCLELDKWCEERIKFGDPKGQWLKTKLDEVRAADRLENIYRGGGTGYRSRPITELDSSAGDYDGGPEDQLIVKHHKWDQHVRQVGWFAQSSNGGARRGQHGLTRENLGNFWMYCHGSQHATRGIDGGEMYGPGTPVWLDMWIPNSKCQGVGACTCELEDELEDE